MPNKRYALVVRLWQVKGEQAGSAANLLAPSNDLILTEPIVYHHWRGAVQLAGDTQLHYFNSLPELNQLIARLVDGASDCAA
jgi:hypothetical protein